MLRELGRAALAACLTAVLPRTAFAADGGLSGVRFSADDVEADWRLQELVLRGNVLVAYDRFRLTSADLRLRRSARGVEIDGRGQVVFCPCAEPPIGIGFSGATVAPPADLLLRVPRLEIAGTTVFALPWFWLRAPTRPGLLPPVVAWRGSDGLLLGGGIHVPWRRDESFDELDLTAGGYMRGGVEITARLRTRESTARARWDHLGDDLFSIDARGSVSDPESATIGWDLDVVRGKRARSGLLLLEEGARAHDHASADVLVQPSSVVLSAGVLSVGPRGGSGPSPRTAWGPRWTAASSGALGAAGFWDAASQALLLHDAKLGAVELARFQTGAELDARPGPLLLRVTARQSTTLAQAATSSGADVVAAGQVQASLPLLRLYGTAQEPFAHVVQPQVQGTFFGAHGTGEDGLSQRLAPGRGVSGLAMASLRNEWGAVLGRSAGSLEVGAAVVSAPWEPSQPPRGAGRWRAAWDFGWSALAGEGAMLSGPSGQVTVVRARIGRREGVHAQVGVASRTGTPILLARLLSSARALEPSGEWLSTEGTTLSGDLTTRLGGSVELGAGVVEDWTSRELLATRGWGSYLHPCRCLRLDAFAAHRLGRGGIDAWLSIDLAPR